MKKTKRSLVLQSIALLQFHSLTMLELRNKTSHNVPYNQIISPRKESKETIKTYLVQKTIQKL